MINFSVCKTEARLITQIVKRAMEIAKQHGLNYPPLECDMDITACHVNGCPLDLDKLLAATDYDFMHDVWGIRRHINRETGKLENCFVPRYSDTQNQFSNTL